MLVELTENAWSNAAILPTLREAGWAISFLMQHYDSGEYWNRVPW